MESLVGHLLVATPSLRDPNFDRTVVLLVAHEEGGALGVVLNRATEVPVGEVLGAWGGVASDPRGGHWNATNRPSNGGRSKAGRG